MVTKGIDISINTRNLIGKFSWNTEVGFSYVNNKVTDYAASALTENSLVISGLFGDGTKILGVRNKSPYSIFSLPFAGLDPATGDPQGYLGKTISKNYQDILNQGYDTANLIYNGSAIPVYYGYLNNVFTYKGFTLMVNISYRLGYYFRKNTISYYNLINSYYQHPDYEKRWIAAGDENHANIPSLKYPSSDSYRDDFFARSSVNVLKGDNIRLQNIKLSYDFKTSSNKKFFARDFQVYGNIENLGLIWRANKEGLDPDYNIGNAAFPVPKVYTMGLRVNL